MPEPLEVALSCKEWGVLPEAGGLKDQPITLWKSMNHALNAYRMLSEYERMRKIGGNEWREWQMNNESIVELVASLAKGE